MTNELQAAQKSGQKVLVHGHIPPGYRYNAEELLFNTVNYNSQYIQVLEGYGGMIIG